MSAISIARVLPISLLVLLLPVFLLLLLLLLLLVFLLHLKHLRKADVSNPSNIYNSHLVEEDEEDDEDGRAAKVEGDQVGAQKGRQEAGLVEEEDSSQSEQGDNDENHVLIDSKLAGQLSDQRKGHLSNLTCGLCVTDWISRNIQVVFLCLVLSIFVQLPFSIYSGQKHFVP